MFLKDQPDTMKLRRLNNGINRLSVMTIQLFVSHIIITSSQDLVASGSIVKFLETRFFLDCSKSAVDKAFSILSV